MALNALAEEAPTSFRVSGREVWDTGRVITSINPADGSVAGRVVRAGVGEVDVAVAAARAAFLNSGWAQLRPDARASVLHRVSDAISAEGARLAELQMRDTGKPLTECQAMVAAASKAFRYYASVLETHETEVTPPRGDYFSFTVLEPYGVVAAITPWNSPIMNEANKAAPALAAGNAVIIKPSEETPLLALELVRIAVHAGVPEGIFSALPGHGEDVGDRLVRHPDVRMISFTGGTDTGRHIARAAAERLVPVALELGGKSPNIVFADADLELAVAGVVAGIFSSAGQSCVAGSRVYVERGVWDEVVPALVERAGLIRVGAPDDPATQMGPLVSVAHRDRVAAYVDAAIRVGASVLIGGSAPTDRALEKGAYYLPTILTDVSPKARVVQEEIFGPVLVVLPFDGEADAIEQANDTVFGLACGIWTRDVAKAWRVGRAIEAGSVWVNTYKQSSLSSPFGGFKDSGIAREKGVQGLRLYSELKSVYYGVSDVPMKVEK